MSTVTGRALPAATAMSAAASPRSCSRGGATPLERARSSSRAALAWTCASRASSAAASVSPAAARRSSAARSSCSRTRRCCGPSWMSRSRRRSPRPRPAPPRHAQRPRRAPPRPGRRLGQRPSRPCATRWWSRASPFIAQGRVIAKMMPATRYSTTSTAQLDQPAEEPRDRRCDVLCPTRRHRPAGRKAPQNQ